MAQYLRPNSDIAAGGWTGNYTDIDEEMPNDGDYLSSPKNPAGAVYECGLSAVTDPGVDTGHVVRYRAYTSKQSGLVVRLMQGATTIASQTPSLTGSFAQYSFTLTEAEAGNITDYSGLSLEFEGNGVANTIQYVSWAEFEIPDAAASDDLSADNLDSASPATGESAFGQIHELTADGLDSPTPALEQPDIGQMHDLAANAIASGAAVSDSPTLESAAEDALTTDSLASSAPVMGQPAVGQEHGLTADGLAAGSTALEQPDVGQEHSLTADALASGAATTESPSIGQEHALDADALASGSGELAESSIGQEHALAGDGLESAAGTLATPTVGTEGIDVLTAAGLVAGTPQLAEAILAQIHALLADALASQAPLVDGPAIGQDHSLASESLTGGTTALDRPDLTEEAHSLQADDLTAGALALEMPTLGLAGVASLEADDIEVLNVILSNPSLWSSVRPGRIRATVARLYGTRVSAQISSGAADVQSVGNVTAGAET